MGDHPPPPLHLPPVALSPLSPQAFPTSTLALVAPLGLSVTHTTRRRRWKKLYTRSFWKAFFGKAITCATWTLGACCFLWLTSYLFEPAVRPKPSSATSITITLFNTRVTSPLEGNSTVQLHRDGRDILIPIVEACSDYNWSAGSAYLTIIALPFGYYAHPRGSVSLNLSGRVWRLSPLFTLVESIVILKRIFTSLWHGYPIRVICFTLLAVRCGNAWAPSDTATLLKIQESHKTNVHNNAESLIDAEEPAELVQETSPVTATRVIPWMLPANIPIFDYSTIPQEYTQSTESRPRRNPSSTRTQGDEETNGGATSTAIQPADLLEPDETKESIRDMIFQEHLNNVAAYEHGPSVRIFIWIPMLLQAIKLLSVTGAIAARVLGFIYFLSWFIVEFMMIVAASRPMWHYQRCIFLGRKWRKSFHLGPTDNLLHETWYNESDETKTFKFSPYVILVLGMLANGYVATSMTLIGNWREKLNVLPEVFGDNLGRVLSMAVIWPAAFLLILINWIGPLLVAVAIFFLRLAWLNAKIGVIKCLGGDDGAAARQLELVALPGMDSVMFASCAITSAILICPSFAGVGVVTNFSFNCLGTSKPWWYDWLG